MLSVLVGPRMDLWEISGTGMQIRSRLWYYTVLMVRAKKYKGSGAPRSFQILQGRKRISKKGSNASQI